MIINEAYKRKSKFNEEEEWKTIRGTHVMVNDDGEVTKGPQELKNLSKKSGSSNQYSSSNTNTSQTSMTSTDISDNQVNSTASSSESKDNKLGGIKSNEVDISENDQDILDNLIKGNGKELFSKLKGINCKSAKAFPSKNYPGSTVFYFDSLDYPPEELDDDLISWSSKVNKDFEDNNTVTYTRYGDNKPVKVEKGRGRYDPTKYRLRDKNGEYEITQWVGSDYNDLQILYHPN